MYRFLARKKPASRKRSNSATSSAQSVQRFGESYVQPRYKAIVSVRDTFMDEHDLGVSEESQELVQTLLDAQQPVARDTAFDDDIFKNTCRKLRDRNESRVVQDIARLIVPSAEALAARATALEILAESVNDAWNNPFPLLPMRPQPDYAVGFARSAFTSEQFEKLSPFVGNTGSGDRAFFMATWYLHFPFLVCEVKCGNGALDVADSQNANSAFHAVRAVANLFRAVKRQDEVNRRILAFSISHNDRSVRIYGYYPVKSKDGFQYHRHPIHEFTFTSLGGKDKWICYRFTRNVYDLWVPSHIDNIRSAIDTLPFPVDESTSTEVS